MRTDVEKEVETTLGQIQQCISNILPNDSYNAKFILGVIGESPSRYSKSPTLWNAAFRELEIDAHYIPIDVEHSMLGDLLNIFRSSRDFVGANVTVPHKVAVIDHLDKVDSMAQAIGAVNTIVRTPEGELEGYNTDADGLLSSLLKKPSPSAPPFISTLEGKRVVLIGAGGAGQASAFGLAKLLGSGELHIVNRSVGKSEALAAKVRTVFPRSHASSIDKLSTLVTNADLLINASTVGQSGLRSVSDTEVTSLERYSPLASANPMITIMDPSIPEKSLVMAVSNGSQLDIETNNKTSDHILRASHPSMAVMDLIYSPPETVLLAQARELGLPTLNGQTMLLLQAVEAFVNRLMKPYIELASGDPSKTYDRVLAAMVSAW